MGLGASPNNVPVIELIDARFELQDVSFGSIA